MEEPHLSHPQQPLRGVEAEVLLQLVVMAQAQLEGLVVLAQLPPFLVHPQLMLEVEEVAVAEAELEGLVVAGRAEPLAGTELQTQEEEEVEGRAGLLERVALAWLF